MPSLASWLLPALTPLLLSAAFSAPGAQSPDHFLPCANDLWIVNRLERLSRD